MEDKKDTQMTLEALKKAMASDLPNLYDALIYSPDKETRDWARSRIDTIHEAFCAQHINLRDYEKHR